MRLGTLALLLLALSTACASAPPIVVAPSGPGRSLARDASPARTTGPQEARPADAEPPAHEPPRDVLATQDGLASYYSDKFTGRKTASGARYAPGALTAAHLTLPFGTVVRVVNVRTGRSVVVTINDRGPFGHAERVIDLSKAAARQLGILQEGVAPVRVEILRYGSGKRR